MGECKKMTTKKYMNRSSPPYPANKCQGKIKPGNDGMMYKSVSDKNCVHKWLIAGRKSRKSVRKARKSVRKSRKSGRKSRKSGRKYNCSRSKTNKREDLSKELKCHVRNWERITGRSQDLSNERIKLESLSGLKSHLKFYRKNNPYDM